MKKNFSLKIFHLSQPLVSTEWLSIQGDKFKDALSFEWEITEDVTQADVITWDGILTPRMEAGLKERFSQDFSKKIFIIHGEAPTLFQDHPFLKVAFENLDYVEVSGWTALPEEILAAIEVCHQKLNHV